jgi:fructokinase
LASLGFLGWSAYPIGRLAHDAAGDIVRKDLVRWGVHQDFIDLEPTASTPIIVQQIVRTKRGVPVHRFHFSCARCGGWYPTYRPLREDTSEAALVRLKRPDVFFADRVSKGIVRIAKHFADSGALIFFEPCGTGDTKLFREMVTLSHIVKYSQDRAKSFIDVLQSASPLLQIETLGEDGLRYQSRLAGAKSADWRKLDAIDVVDVRDTAGAGDWTTAGLIHSFGRGGYKAFKRTKQSTLVEAFAYAQSLAAWNCKYEGARGGMYASSREELESFVSKKGNSHFIARHDKGPKLVAKALELCEECNPVTGRVAKVSTGADRRILAADRTSRVDPAP